MFFPLSAIVVFRFIAINFQKIFIRFVFLFFYPNTFVESFLIFINTNHY